MLFTYRNHPALGKIRSGELDVVSVIKEDEFSFKYSEGDIKKLWHNESGKFKRRIVKMSESFAEAMALANKKLSEQELIYDSIMAENAGTILSGHFAFCYSFELVKDDEDETVDVRRVIFVFNKDLLLFACDISVCLSKDFIWQSSLTDKHLDEPFSVVQYHIKYIGAVLAFMKHAEIEIKYVSANQKLKTSNAKHANQTDLPIEILDSTWFTTIVRSEGFQVRGHFRLQPYGPGLGQKKLVWISDYQKHGYTKNFKRPLDLD